MNERTRLVLAIAVTAIILFSWQPLLRFIDSKTGWQLLPPPPSTQPIAEPATEPAGAPGIAGVPTTAGSTVMAMPSTQAGQISIATPTTVPSNALIGSAAWKDENYSLQMDVNPIGGGLAGVTLNDYTQRVGSPDPFTFDTPYGDGVQAFTTRSITINGTVQDISRSVWSIVKKDASSVTLGLDITDGKSPLLSIYKQYTVKPRNDGGQYGPLGYETELVTEFVNRTDRPMTVSTNLIGPTFPPSESARGGDRQVIAGYQGKNETIVLGHDALESFSASSPTKAYSALDNQPLVWFGAGGNYFNAIIRPTSGQWIKEATATLVNPENVDPAAHEIVLGVQSTDVQLAPGAAKSISADVFFGPRLRSLLKNAYYSGPSIQYYHTLEIGGSCAFCTFQWLVDILMSLLGFFHAILRDWGLSIICLVFVVRACLHPITKRSQVNMAKMTKFGPELEKLKVKYKDDKEGLNRAMMQFYKNQGATPILGCLPMFLQMPIWVALYSGLSSTFELRQAPFLYGFTWIHDLSKPDHLIQFSQPISFWFLHFDGLNIIPILMAGAFFLQQKLTPKPPATTPEQEQQQKMMQWMTLLFPIMLYSSPAGLNLYIFTSTTFGIIESRIIRKHIKEQEALQSTGPTFVDGEIVAPSNPYAKQPPKKKGGFMGWLADLQEKAEQMRNDADKNKKK